MSSTVQVTKLSVKVKPKARTQRVEKIDQTHYKVWVKAAPERGKANAEVIELLSDYLGLPRRALSVCSGLTSSQKIIQVDRSGPK